MSYEIVYARQFIKVDNLIIPLVLYGSNNSYVMNYSGRYKRDRNWHPMYLKSNEMIAISEENLMARIESICSGGEYQEYFVRNGKWVDDKGLIRFFKNGIKDAKTIEEIQNTYYVGNLGAYLSIWNKSNNSTELITNISTTEELKDFLNKAEERLSNRSEAEQIYVCLRFYSDELKPRQTKEKKKPTERLSDFYAVKIEDRGYLTQLTSRRIKYTFSSSFSKQFKTEKEANKYINKLKERFSCDFSVEHIVA